MKTKFIFLSLFFASSVFAQGITPPKGAINPNVTQANINQTICVTGWTKTIRPPVGYTNKLKAKQLQDPAYTDENPRDYEEDHLISLEIGGSPDSLNNLWPQPYAGDWGARKKDVVETRLKHLVCSGKVTLKDAQTAISTDWVAAYKKYVGEK